MAFHHRALQAVGQKQEQYSDVFESMIKSKEYKTISIGKEG